MGMITLTNKMVTFSFILATVLGTNYPSGSSEPAQDVDRFRPALGDDLTVLILQFTFYDREVVRELSPDLVAVCTRSKSTLPDFWESLIEGGSRLYANYRGEGTWYP